MPSSNTSEAYEIVWLIRRLFRSLGQKSSEMLEAQGISAADRAVLEFLYPDNALSVPEIAQRYQVSRQHIQTTVNSLLESGLIMSRQNPRHKRSPLIELNKPGRELFAAVLHKDEETINQLFADVSNNDIRTTRKTLNHLLTKLKQGDV